MTTTENARTLAKLLSETGKLALQDIRVAEANAKLGALKSGELPTHARQSLKVTFNINKEAKLVQIIVDIGLDAVYEPTQADAAFSVKSVFVMSLAIAAPYSSDAALGQTLQRLALLIIWPYWREFVHSMTTRMGLPPFPLPLMKMDDLAEPANRHKNPRPKKSKSK